MLSGSVAQFEAALRRGFVDLEYVEVLGGTAITHGELVGRLASRYADIAHKAVYELFGVDLPMLKDPDADAGPVTLGDLVSGSPEGDGAGAPGLIGQEPATG